MRTEFDAGNCGEVASLDSTHLECLVFLLSRNVIRFFELAIVLKFWLSYKSPILPENQGQIQIIFGEIHNCYVFQGNLERTKFRLGEA